ncbi:MAG TPA: alpha/beta hydrolase [Propionibacteriaceae bacterium]|nr:alpha/beta hydrolase [Propionibacteriaceae bacterium]
MIAVVVALALIGVTVWQVVPRLGAGNQPSTGPSASGSAGSVPTAAPTGRGGPTQPGQTVSVPPVPSPTATTQRNYNSPDRPKVAIPDVKPQGFVAPPPGSGMDRYLKQSLTWSDCRRNDVDAKCATIAVPLDYAKPDAQAITLFMLKIPATQPRVGSLFVNPGGPGYGGTDLATRFKRDGLEMYDIVGWDPRGTGESTPVQCHNGAEIDALMALDGSPDTPQELQALKDGWKQFAMGCLEKSGPLLAHISTVETVTDLDVMRQLVGDKQLTYLGYSYGTEIGAVYAEKYAKNVGRMVLDSAVNITEDESVVQASGFDLSLRNYAQWCADTKCALGGKTADENVKIVVDLFEKLDSQPLTVGSRKLTQSIAVDGVLLFFYFDQSTWGNLTSRINAARSGNGAPLLQTADSFRDRGADGQYASSLFGLIAINCVDGQDDGIERAMKDWEADKKIAPIFGKYFGPSVTCQQWPVQGTPPFEIHGKGAAPIVVVGGTGDSATPYQYAVWMAQQLESGVLVTYDGAGHATYGNDRSQCVDDAVVTYLADGVVPPYGLFCKS